MMRNIKEGVKIMRIVDTKTSNIKLPFVPSFLNRKGAFLCP